MNTLGLLQFKNVENLFEDIFFLMNHLIFVSLLKSGYKNNKFHKKKLLELILNFKIFFLANY
ncbi:hypothetical protein BpHYR1_000578 [Brachionus plicatilis]|uniref:Uncharacterized protein n=1 Tax=Brachionus plicatilis TaxID=10195 RepID=A0A3M7T442_BRAPC|nr:hypothetical protein BpHYR1_000578 [Brachionus plicatilis]